MRPSFSVRFAVTGVLAVWMAVGSPSPSAAGQPEPAAEVEPFEWARLALEPCREIERQRQLDDRVLADTLATAPASNEQRAFLSREHAARAVAQGRGRQATLGRLNAALFGSGALFGTRGSTDEERFLDVLQGLLPDGDVCALEAIEGTVLLSLLGVPLTADASRQLRPDRTVSVLDRIVSEHLGRGATLEQVFERMRPASPPAPLAYVEQIVRAVGREQQPSPHAGAGLGPDAERRLRQFVGFVELAGEPVRIQFYLQGLLDEIEGALGITLQEGIDQRLFDAVRRRLYGSVERIRRAGRTSPDALVAAIQPIVDWWFRTDVVPAVRRRLASRPFQAYWYFVRTGGVAARGPAFTTSTTTIGRPAFALSDLSGLSMREAMIRLEASRVPPAFLERHGELEAAFVDTTLTRDEAIARTARLPSTQRTRLRDFLLSEAGTDRVSTLDVYARLIRDASLIPGRLDRELARNAMSVLHAAKAERLDREIRRILSDEPAPPPGLEAYLRTAVTLMLELERRQLSEPAFQQGTAGAAVGWLLSQFFVGGHVPVQLWAPGGVRGGEFSELVDALTPRNGESGADYRGKPVDDIDLVHDGREYRDALITVIDSARHFLNVSAFDWKVDAGGRDIAYRLMAKKLGVSGAEYERFLARFERGLPLEPADPTLVSLYDIPTTRFKDLLVSYFIETSEQPQVAAVRAALREAGVTFECATVRTCGDLEALRRQTGTRHRSAGQSPDAERAWQAYRQLEALFAMRPPALHEVRPRKALRDYCEDPDALRRFVRRVGLRRADRPGESFPINIVADAKQNIFNLRPGERSEQFPYFVTEPIRDIYFMLLEFDIRLVLWKGVMEFPWHAWAVPLPGRKIFGVVPMPFVPWPWLNAVPGFTWAGAPTSIFLQYLLSTDVRIWWGMVNHTKSWSSEAVALESGMGMALKYFNGNPRHRTWHDMGVLVRGAPVNDVNDHFVQVFNEARVNNRGLPASRGATIPRLRYQDYRQADGAAEATDRARPSRAWVLTTHPERGDSSYRGVFVAALAAAQQNIYIENSFFSDPLIARMLRHKAREFRGRVSCDGLGEAECAARVRDAVQIYLVLPESSDKPIVDAVGTSDFYDMLRLGIKVHRWSPDSGWSASRMLHSKVWLIDYQPGEGGLAYVGAANATQRSHLADNEVGILSDDPEFARQVYERVFVPDITHDSRLETGQTFRTVRSSNSVVRTSKWLRRLLVELFWFI